MSVSVRYRSKCGMSGDRSKSPTRLPEVGLKEIPSSPAIWSSSMRSCGFKSQTRSIRRYTPILLSYMDRSIAKPAASISNTMFFSAWSHHSCSRLTLATQCRCLRRMLSRRKIWRVVRPEKTCPALGVVQTPLDFYFDTPTSSLF